MNERTPPARQPEHLGEPQVPPGPPSEPSTPSAEGGTRRVAVVAHTHWDREWYKPFQEFRLDLVTTMDALLALLESDPSFRTFLCDGQMALIDDYLEIRPDAEDRIRTLATAGRLSVGPWYILMDEFLVSAETIVRNLQMGMARAGAFGGAMLVGYLPDMFGHIAQMPQILRQAGIEHAVVWRGVPQAIKSTGFWWEAPDGSTVRAEYLPRGYGNGATLPDDAKALVKRAAAHEREIADYLIDEILWMNGSDHLPAQPFVGRVLEEANELQDAFRFSMSSLTEYLERAPTVGLPRWRGELRSGARANILMGVTSSRVDVKRAAARAALALERRAEPYAALFSPPPHWPGEALGIAWRSVVRNAAHDSICACSVDEVTDAVLGRYVEARQIADAVARRALGDLAASMSDPGPVIVNPSHRCRSGVAELVIVGDRLPDANEQVLSERTGLPGSLNLDAASVRMVLAMLQGTRIADEAWVTDVRIDEDPSRIIVTVTVSDTERPGVPIDALKENLIARLDARPDAEVQVRLDQPPVRRVAARVADVPGFGWKTYAPAPLSNPASAVVGGADATASEPSDRQERSNEVVLTNGLVTVAIDSADGTFAIDGIPGYGRLVDGGDLGDSYNYSPPPHDSVVDTPDSVTVTVAERGPVRASAVIAARYRWPDHIDPRSGQRTGEQFVEVSTKLSLHADEPIVRVQTRFVNPSRDHRVRVHLPLPDPAEASVAECAFGTVTRGLSAEGRAEEYGLPTFPSRRFVRAGNLTVCHVGLNEYELVDCSEVHGQQRAHALALTLLRSTGMLSRIGMAYRPVPAGPLVPVEGLQLVGKVIEADYALALGDVDPWAMCDEVFLGFETVTSLGGGWRPPVGGALGVRGAEVTAVRREHGMLEVRVFNPTDHAATVEFDDASGWLVDLRGRPLERFDSSFVLRPFGIATVRLSSAARPAAG